MIHSVLRSGFCKISIYTFPEGNQGSEFRKVRQLEPRYCQLVQCRSRSLQDALKQVKMEGVDPCDDASIKRLQTPELEAMYVEKAWNVRSEEGRVLK